MKYQLKKVSILYLLATKFKNYKQHKQNSIWCLFCDLFESLDEQIS